MLAGAEVATPLCNPTFSGAHTLSKSMGWAEGLWLRTDSKPCRAESGRPRASQTNNLSPFCILRQWGVLSRANLGELDRAVPRSAELCRAERVVKNRQPTERKIP